MTFAMVTDFILKWLLPYSVAACCLLAVIHYLEKKYNEANLDLFWGTLIRWMIMIGLITLVLSYISHLQFWGRILVFLHNIANLMRTWPAVGFIVRCTQIMNLWISQQWSYWSTIYIHAFSIVFVFGIIVELCALTWRISFWRSFNVIWPLVVFFPFLLMRYLWGYQTPIQDFMLAGILKAKLRENLNDSYENLDRHLDADGKPFQEGAGGSVQTQTRKAVNRAMKRARVSVKTTSDGKRHARVFVRQSRETETDRAIFQVLKGWGERNSGQSIYFPQDATYSNKLKGYFFSSEVPYNAGDELGSFRAIFANPFEKSDFKVDNGQIQQRGVWQNFRDLYTNLWHYIRHFTPYAFYSFQRHRIDQKFFIDASENQAKFRVQHNLDLTGLSPTLDVDTGNTVEVQKQRAIQAANSKRQDVETALSSFKIYGQFKQVVVGGSQAIYTFTLPPDAKLPNNFDKIQIQMANILQIREIPIITLHAGELSVSVNNGVNIPVSFADMIKKRPRGVSSIISGIVGEDALGHPIEFSLNDHVPHAILFGKTGTGKTVSIEDILYSVMDATDPQHLQIEYIDGKGNSFEHLKDNPFTRSEPADASSDIAYARAKLINLEKECRDRIELFKRAQVSKLSEYNKWAKSHNKPILPEILLVFDEFSAVIQKDKELSGKDFIKYNTIDPIEYLAKMARSVGIRMLLANQSARKELVPGKISANIPGRVSLGVSEPIEAEIALPETGIKVNLISQPGEFYSLMKGATHPEHGNSPYLTDDDKKYLDVKLSEKFSQFKHYDINRGQMMHDAGLDEKITPVTAQQAVAEGTRSTIARANKKVTIKASEIKTPDEDLSKLSLVQLKMKAKQYAPYLKVHERELVDNSPELKNPDEKRRERAKTRAKRIKEIVDKELDRQGIIVEDDRQPDQAHRAAGDKLGQVVNDHNLQL